MKACLFPGQGSQFAGMGGDLFKRYQKLTDLASEILGYSVETLCLRDPERRLSRTQYTQPALYVVNALSYLAEQDDGKPAPDFLAGHSLGEYSALFAAQCFDFADGLALVAERARLMSQVSGSGMAAITRLRPAQIASILQDDAFSNIDIANYNSDTQTVVSGDSAQLQTLAPIVEEHGGRCFPLQVSGAFHSRYMRDVQRQFETFLSSFEFVRPTVPVIANVSAQPYPDDSLGIRSCLASQISASVRWVETIRRLNNEGVQQFVEVGPSRILKQLTAEILAASESSSEVTSLKRIPSARTADADPRVMFLCPGQGGQHYAMGRRVYHENRAFRDTFDRCDTVAKSLIGRSVAALVYEAADESRVFSRTLETHLANFIFEYSMICLLRAQGVHPGVYVACSLGEYVALAATGALSLEAALKLVARQGELAEQECAPAGMMTVMQNVSFYYAAGQAFAGCALAGINADKAFVVCGAERSIEEARAKLVAKGIACHRLPISHGFHTADIDTMEHSFRKACAGIEWSTPSVSVYSCAARGVPSKIDSEHAWRICRAQFNFPATLRKALQEQPSLVYDVGPSGTLANYARMILPRSVEICTYADVAATPQSGERAGLILDRIGARA